MINMVHCINNRLQCHVTSFVPLSCRLMSVQQMRQIKNVLGVETWNVFLSNCFSK